MSGEEDQSYAGEGIYRENILDHFQNPRNAGIIEAAEIRHREYNPLCGDTVEISVKLNSGKAIDVKFNGSGCAISQSSASMLTEAIKGKTLVDIKMITKEDIMEMLSIPIGPVRIKCALLSLDTLRNGILVYEKYGPAKRDGNV